MLNWLSRITLAVALLTPIHSLEAQACWGSFRSEGQFSLGAGVRLGEGYTSYRLTGGANSGGPIAVAAGISITDADDLAPKWTGIGMNIGYEMAAGTVSVCPGLGLSYEWNSTVQDGLNYDVGVAGLAFGFGIGRSFAVGDNGVVLLPSVEPFLWSSVATYTVSDGVDRGQQAVGRREAGIAAGLSVGLGQFYLSSSVTATSVKGSRPSFGLGFTVLLN